MVSKREFGVSDREDGEAKAKTDGDGEAEAKTDGDGEGEAKTGEEGEDREGKAVMKRWGAASEEEGGDREGKSAGKTGQSKDVAGVESKKEANNSDNRANDCGENGKLGSWQMADVSGSIVNAKFIGPVGMSLALNSDPTFDGKEKSTERLISFEPDKLTEPAMITKILEKKIDFNNNDAKIRCSHSTCIINNVFCQNIMLNSELSKLF